MCRSVPAGQDRLTLLLACLAMFGVRLLASLWVTIDSRSALTATSKVRRRQR
jgi:hypothetical protein